MGLWAYGTIGQWDYKPIDPLAHKPISLSILFLFGANKMAKTALDLTDEEIKSYKLGVRPKNWQSEERWNKAYEIALTAVKLLRESFAAKRVVIFGSLVHRERFNPWSDIDIAAWGIPADHFYKAVAAVTGLSRDFHVDLVDPEDCWSTIRQVIEEDGIDV
jgi:predicted nucleotidyltransferase